MYIVDVFICHIVQVSTTSVSDWVIEWQDKVRLNLVLMIYISKGHWLPHLLANCPAVFSYLSFWHLLWNSWQIQRSKWGKQVGWVGQFTIQLLNPNLDKGENKSEKKDDQISSKTEVHGHKVHLAVHNRVTEESFGHLIIDRIHAMINQLMINW